MTFLWITELLSPEGGEAGGDDGVRIVFSHEITTHAPPHNYLKGIFDKSLYGTNKHIPIREAVNDRTQFMLADKIIICLLTSGDRGKPTSHRKERACGRGVTI